MRTPARTIPLARQPAARPWGAERDTSTVPSLWNDGVATPLAPPAPGDAVYIQAIADNGALAGIVSRNNSQWQLARHVAAGWELIGAPANPSGSVYGVNRAGHVVAQHKQ